MDAAVQKDRAGFQPYYKKLLCSFLKQCLIRRKLEGVMSPQACGSAVNHMSFTAVWAALQHQQLMSALCPKKYNQETCIFVL